jgi:hypothetical protein
MNGTISRPLQQFRLEIRTPNIFLHSQAETVVFSPLMRIYLLFPLAFVSGIYGFIIFAPYLIAVVAVGHLVRQRRSALATVRREVKIAAPVTDMNGVFLASAT